MEQQLHRTTERLGTDPLPRLIVRLGLPGIISMLSISLYNLVDAFWVGRLGYQAVAALTVTMPFYVFSIAAGVGTGTGAGALASRRFGEKNTDAANAIAGQSFFLALLLGIAFLLLTNLLPRQILLISGATPDIIGLGQSYLVVIGWGMPFFFTQLISRSVFNASGDALRPMLFTIVGQVCNIILDPCFIFGWGFFPEMGIRGAAIATVIANAASTGIALGYIINKRTAYRIKWSHLVPNLRLITGIYHVGLPTILMESTESLVFALFNNVVAGFGSVALAALGIAGRISDLAFMPVFGLSQGLLPIIGFSLGARHWQRLWGSVKLTAVSLSVLMASLTIILEIFAPQTIALFNKDPELIRIGAPGMRIFISTLVLIGPVIVFITAFQGLSKGKTAMVLSLARQFIFFVPALFILPGWLGLAGVWLSLPVSDTMGFIISGLLLYREYRLQKKSPEWVPYLHPGSGSTMKTG